MYLLELDEPLSASSAARRLAPLGGLCWLDGDGSARQGRYSFVACCPTESLLVAEPGADPFGSLDAAARAECAAHRAGERAHFSGGLRASDLPAWAGFISYHAVPPARTGFLKPTSGEPALLFQRHDAWFMEDHARGVCAVVGDDRAACNRLAQRLAEMPDPALEARVERLRAPCFETHARNITAVLDHIARGDIYQVNLAHAWHGELIGDPLWLAARMRATSPVPFGAYLEHGDTHLLVRSMEQFMRFDKPGGRVWSRPIKGTLARPLSDAHSTSTGGRGEPVLSARLRHDPKERAEHAMIVDLMRNDLSRIARVGSVRVEDVMAVEPYRGLFHLVSTVACDARAGVGVGDVLRATFPPGSVTGAPKQRALEIIDALESEARGPYTGAVGHVDRAGGCNFAVAIRTAVVRRGRVTYHAGGGIVEASDVQRELAETELKARVFLDAIAEPAKPTSGAVRSLRDLAKHPS